MRTGAVWGLIVLCLYRQDVRGSAFRWNFTVINEARDGFDRWPGSGAILASGRVGMVGLLIFGGTSL